MGGNEARINDAARCVDDLLTVFAFERADARNPTLLDADGAARAHRLAEEPGEDTLCALNERQFSAPTSLSCQLPSASLERPIITANRLTPASVIRRSAANMRGISSAKPD